MIREEVGDGFQERCHRLFEEYGAVLAGLVVMQLVVYSYFFTTLIFTNHTFPNSWVFPYPSYKTEGEGRWLADLIIWLQGGSGVQPFQMALAAVLQSANGVLFARVVGLERRLDVILAAAFICLYPAFLDNYSFGMDHLTFALADTFALIGILYCRVKPRTVSNGVVVAALFVLALASYQPKIAFVGLLCLCYLATYLVDGRRPFSSTDAISATSYVSAIFVAACVLYFLSAKLTIVYDIGARGHLNSPREMWNQALASYTAFYQRYTTGADYLPHLLRALPKSAILLGGLALLGMAYRRHRIALAMVAGLLLVLPILLRVPHIINQNAWEDAGRIDFVYGYALLLFMACGLRVTGLKTLLTAILGVFLYFFVIVGTQESNAAALKTVYDLNMINRIATRIENATGDLYQKKHALVVLGRYPEFARSKYTKYPNARVHAQTFAFAAYRQPEILNYFFGREVLMRPTPSQMESALGSVKGRQPWPATDAVFVLDDIIVVLLQEYYPDIDRTWTTQQ